MLRHYLSNPNPSVPFHTLPLSLSFSADPPLSLSNFPFFPPFETSTAGDRKLLSSQLVLRLCRPSHFKAETMSILVPDELRVRRKQQPILPKPKPKKMKPKYRSEFTEADFEAEKRTLQWIKDSSLERQKALELERAQMAAEEEKEPWPPVWKPIQESVQFKSGMIDTFVERRAIEDMDDSDFSSHPYHRAYGDPDLLNKLKIFFKLVRDTRGYDVDWVPPLGFYSPFRPMHDVHRSMNADRSFKMTVNGMLECVVDKINARAKNHGEEYKVLKVEKIVEAPRFWMRLITFSVELVSSHGDGGMEKDVQALVRMEGGREYTCLEWRFKPVEPPSEDGQSNQEPVKRFVRRSTRLSNAAVAAPAADPEPPKKKKTKTKTETNSAVEKKGEEAKASLSPAVENHPRPSMS